MSIIEIEFIIIINATALSHHHFFSILLLLILFSTSFSLLTCTWVIVKSPLKHSLLFGDESVMSMPLGEPKNTIVLSSTLRSSLMYTATGQYILLSSLFSNIRSSLIEFESRLGSHYVDGVESRKCIFFKGTLYYVMLLSDFPQITLNVQYAY